MNKYFEIIANIHLYDSDKGRKSFILNGYRPHIYFGFSDPTNFNYSTDCIVNLINTDKIYPGETSKVKIIVLRYEHLKGLLELGAKLKLKEGVKFIGEGVIKEVIGEKRY